MSETIRQADLRNDNAAIMRRVAAGESFTVTVNGVPVADVVPHQRRTRRVFLPAAEMDSLLADEPTVDLAGWEVDQARWDDRLAAPDDER